MNIDSMPNKPSEIVDVNFIKQMLDNLDLGALIVNEDREIRYSNPVVKSILGYHQDEIVGKKTDLLYGDRRIDPNNKREIYNRLQSFGFHEGRATGISKDGKKLDLSVSTFLVKPHRSVIVLIKQTKEPTKKVAGIDTQSFLQHLLDNIPDSIYFKDKDNKFVLVNKAHAKALNARPEEFIGKTDMDFFPPELANKFLEDDTRVMETGVPVIGKIEKSIRPTTGEVTYVITTKVPHYDEHGKIVGTMGLTRDITDKMIAEEELHIYKDRLEELVKERTKQLEESKEKLLKMYTIKSEFTSMVSHELRTPLTVIKESVSIIHNEVQNLLTDDQKEFFGMALRNVDRLSRLINDILDFSKLEAKKMKFKITRGDVKALIRQVATSYESILGKKGLKLIVELDHSLPFVKMDEDRVAQVLYNLISNAIKFTDKGSISIGANVEDNMVRTYVEDTGCGIKKEHLHRLFEKFEQLAPNVDTKSTGTGLGLAICKQIVEQLGGHIHAESNHGKGSIFSFTLPIA